MPDVYEKILELQWKLLYATVVAGKKATFAENVMGKFMQLLVHDDLPFDYIRRNIKHGMMHNLVHSLRTGSYKRIERCWTEAIELDPETCTIEELEEIHGIGPKTARFFVLWTREGVRCAALDVHILHWLRDNGYPSAPRSTPQAGKKYKYWEDIFLKEADERGKTPRELDGEIWTKYSGYKETI